MNSILLVVALSITQLLAGVSYTSNLAPTATHTPVPQLTEPYIVKLNPADFVSVVDNPYFPLIPGSRYTYEGKTDEGLERIEIEVLSRTRKVVGITATVLHDIVYINGVLVEDTFDWYAQDKDGNVWYLGEDVKNYKNGKLADKAGSWEAGVDGAVPGIIMHGKPATQIGKTYRQEYYKGEAEDVGEVLSVSATVTVPYRSFDNVVQTYDWTPLDPDLQEHKFYAPGIGTVKSINLKTGEEVVLIGFARGGNLSSISNLGMPRTGGIAHFGDNYGIILGALAALGGISLLAGYAVRRKNAQA